MKRTLPHPGGAGVFRRMFTRLGCHGRPPHFLVEFYPYANLTHTIRLQEEVAYVRFSDLMRGAPLAAQEAAAAVLLARLYRRPIPRGMIEAYREFSLAHPMRRRLDRIRRKRARRAADRPQGNHYDLALLYATLNRRLFGGRLPRPRLAWSARPWRRQLGIFDQALGQIVLSSRLDRSDVPRYAVEYVLYHEMLHVKHPICRARCGLQAHSAEFRREEQHFPEFARARRFLMRLA